MYLNQLIQKLKALENEYGDLEVFGNQYTPDGNTYHQEILSAKFVTTHQHPEGILLLE